MRRVSSSFVGANVSSCAGAAAWLGDWARAEGLEVETLPWGDDGTSDATTAAAARAVSVTVRANDGLSGAEALLAAAPLPPSSAAATGTLAGDRRDALTIAVAPPAVPHGAFLLAGVAASLAGGGAPWLGKDAVFVWTCDGDDDGTSGGANNGDRISDHAAPPVPVPAGGGSDSGLRSFLERYHYNPANHGRHWAAAPSMKRVEDGGTALLRLALTLQRLLLSHGGGTGDGAGARAAASAPRRQQRVSRPSHPPPPPLAHHSGPLRAGLFLDLPPLPSAAHPTGAATHDVVHVLPHGARGRLPELDYVALVTNTYVSFGVDVAPRRGTFPAAEAARRAGHALAQSPWGARALELLTARVARARAQLTGGPVVPFTQRAAGEYVDRLADAVSFAHALLWPGVGAGLPPHAEMLQHGIHAVTVTTAAAATASDGARASSATPASSAAVADSLLRHGRAVERILRGMSTADERLHASHYFYLLLSPQAFVGINEYAIPFGLAHAPLLVLTATAIVSGRQLAAALLAWWAAAATGAAWYAALFADGAVVEAALALASNEAIAAVVAAGLLLQLLVAAAVTVLLRRTVLRGGGGGSDAEPASEPASAGETHKPSLPPAPRAPSDRFAWVFLAWMAFGLPQFAMLYALYPLADGHALLMVPVLVAYSLAPWRRARGASGSAAASSSATGTGVEKGSAATSGDAAPARCGGAVAAALSALAGAVLRALRLAALVALPVGVPAWLGAGAPPLADVRLADLVASAAGLLHGAVALAPHGGITLPWLYVAWAPPLALLLASELL